MEIDGDFGKKRPFQSTEYSNFLFAVLRLATHCWSWYGPKFIAESLSFTYDYQATQIIYLQLI
jgi:hypothetical protein